MRILQVFDLLSKPYGGGTVDVLLKLSKALKDRGYEVTICAGDYKYDNTDLDVKLYKSWFNKHGMYIMPGLFKFDVKDYDIIHLHCLRSFQNAIICSKAAKYNIPYIIDAHGSTVNIPGKKQIIKSLFDRYYGQDILRHAKRYIAETEIGVDEYKRLGVDSRKIRLLHPMIDTSEFDNLPRKGLFRQRYKIKNKIILFVGRIHENKGIEYLVDAIANLPACLVIVGQDDGYKSTLERLIKDKGLSDRVIFTGYSSGQDKLSALVDADVLVQPSKNEAGARPSLEALLCGTPVIVSRNTGAGQEIAKFDGGLLFDYGDVDSLVKALIRTFNEPDKRIKKAQEYIRDNLSFDKQIEQYESLYREVLV